MFAKILTYGMALISLWLLSSMVTKLSKILKRIKEMADKFDVLTETLEAQTSAVQATVTLITNLVSQFEDAKDDPEQIQVLVDKARANTQALADAVAANTPAAEAPTE